MIQRHHARRGMTGTELVVTVAAISVILCIAVPGFSDVHSTSHRQMSADNLRTLGTHHACYASDWNDRQFTAAPDDLSEFDGYNDYVSATGCMMPIVVGWSESNLFAYTLECDGLWIGLSGNFQLVVPYAFTWGQNLGSFRMTNCRTLHDYGDGRWYSPVYFAPGDWRYDDVEPKFAIDQEYVYEFSHPNSQPSSYIMSAASMFHPDVLRQPEDGGFQSPGGFSSPGAFPDGYRSPTVSQTQFAALKSRIMEHHWIDEAPSADHPSYVDVLLQPQGGAQPWLFNHGARATALALFFDGAVDVQHAGRVARDAERLRAQTGGDSTLWSRDTPLGVDGYQGEHSVDGTRVSHHVLTTEGIRGRDRLAGDDTTGADR